MFILNKHKFIYNIHFGKILYWPSIPSEPVFSLNILPGVRQPPASTTEFQKDQPQPKQPAFANVSSQQHVAAHL